MRFKHYFYEAKIIGGRSDREVLKRPNIVDIPEEVKGKRLFTAINDDTTYFTFAFDNPKDKLPNILIIGNAENPNNSITPIDNASAEALYMRYFNPPEDPKDARIHEYGGEVRIHPPFKRYKEFPQDVNAYFFTDFENPNAVYRSGKTIDEPFELVSDDEVVDNE